MASCDLTWPTPWKGEAGEQGGLQAARDLRARQSLKGTLWSSQPPTGAGGSARSKTGREVPTVLSACHPAGETRDGPKCSSLQNRVGKLCLVCLTPKHKRVHVCVAGSKTRDPAGPPLIRGQGPGRQTHVPEKPSLRRGGFFMREETGAEEQERAAQVR